MREFNADTAKSLFEPLKITLEGREYIVKVLRISTLRKVTDLAAEVKANKDKSGVKKDRVYDILIEQLALLLNAKTVTEFANDDIFKINAVLDYFNKQLEEQSADEKKPKAESSKRPG